MLTTLDYGIYSIIILVTAYLLYTHDGDRELQWLCFDNAAQFYEFLHRWQGFGQHPKGWTSAESVLRYQIVDSSDLDRLVAGLVWSSCQDRTRRFRLVYNWCMCLLQQDLREVNVWLHKYDTSHCLVTAKRSYPNGAGRYFYFAVNLNRSHVFLLDKQPDERNLSRLHHSKKLLRHSSSRYSLRFIGFARDFDRGTPHVSALPEAKATSSFNLPQNGDLATPASSDFLSLPPEIRIRIYDNIIQLGFLHQHHRDGIAVLSATRYAVESHASGLGLMIVSKAISAEFLGRIQRLKLDWPIAKLAGLWTRQPMSCFTKESLVVHRNQIRISLQVSDSDRALQNSEQLLQAILASLPDLSAEAAAGIHLQITVLLPVDDLTKLHSFAARSRALQQNLATLQSRPSVIEKVIDFDIRAAITTESKPSQLFPSLGRCLGLSNRAIYKCYSDLYLVGHICRIGRSDDILDTLEVCSDLEAPGQKDLIEYLRFHHFWTFSGPQTYGRTEGFVLEHEVPKRRVSSCLL